MPAASPFALGHSSPTVGIRDPMGNVLAISNDQFGRLRVSSPLAIFAHKQIDIEPPNIVTATALGSGATATYVTATSSTVITSTQDGQAAVLQTVRRFNYEAGKSQLAFITGLLGLGSKSAGAETAFMRMGQFDGESGAYWEVSSAGSAWTNYLCLRSGTITSQRVAQADWNIDRLDGTKRPNNPSGVLLDPATCQILTISYEWLGVGGLVIGFVFDNQIIPAHFFPHANLFTDVYMRTPNLPMRWEAVCVGAALPTATLKAICTSVISEGGAEQIGRRGGDYRTGVVTVSNGEVRELISMRLRCDGTTDGLEAISSATIFPEDVSVVNTSNDTGIIAVAYNPTFTGAGTWGNPPGANGAKSHVQTCKTGRVVTDIGNVLFLHAFSSADRTGTGNFDKEVALGCRPKIATGYGVADVISLMLINTSGSPTTAFGTLNWREVT